jgi:hypothetical protein
MSNFLVLFFKYGVVKVKIFMYSCNTLNSTS